MTQNAALICARIFILFAGWMSLLVVCPTQAASHFSAATFNLESYLMESRGSFPAKSEISRSKIREYIHLMNPDVLAIQEVGGQKELDELKGMLEKEGCAFPFAVISTGFDTNLSIAILSRLPIIQTRAYTNLSYLHNGRRFRVGRPFLEADIRVNPQYAFTLLTAHLKSKRQVAEADESELRLQEALLLREVVDARLKASARTNLLIAADLNDIPSSAAIRAILGKGKTKLIDTRPAEKNGDDILPDNPNYAPRKIFWTHFFAKEQSYTRLDYILLSPGMASEWQEEQTMIPRIANWGAASDHRPVVAGFMSEERK
jgi:endonuclease/exonuclease/phosphatase family metal-dependent hydrolase